MTDQAWTGTKGSLGSGGGSKRTGNYLAYECAGTNVVPLQTDPNQATFNVFLYERATGTNTLISHSDGSNTNTAAVTSPFPAISADGAMHPRA